MKVIESVPESPQAYLDELVRRSKAGLFPSNQNGSTFCMYRNPEGRACAAGVLIPDDKYDSDMEAKTACKLARDEPELFPDWAEPNNLAQVQRVHDNQVCGGRRLWDHSKFVADLLRCELFKGLSPANP